MKIEEVMTKAVKTCTPGTDLAAAARSMWMRNCNILPVVDDKEEVVGVITDRDVCIATGCRRRDPATILVSEAMTTQVHSCSPEADLCEALQLMQQKQVRRLPVIDAAGKLRGILSMHDVALKVRPDAKAPELSAQELHAILRSFCSHPTKSGEPGQAQEQPQAREQKAAV